MGHFVDNPHADPVQHLVGNTGPVGGHEVCGGDRAESQSVVIGPAVTHNAHGTHVGEHREILVHGALQMGLSDLVPENEVCQAQSVQFVLRHLADDPDGKARARERLAHDQILRQAQLPTKLTDLVLEEHPQGFDDLLEVHIVRQAAHVVVALDDGGVAGAGLDHIGIDGALDQVIHLADLFGLRLKDTDEFLPDDPIIAIEDATVIPKIPNFFDKVTLKAIFIITPITPFFAVIFVFPIENNIEFKISLTPVKKIPIAYPVKAITVRLTALSEYIPLL